MTYADFSSLYQKHWYTRNLILFVSILQKQVLFLQTVVCAPVPRPSQASFWQICLYVLIHAVQPSPLATKHVRQQICSISHSKILQFSKTQLWSHLFCVAQLALPQEVKPAIPLVFTNSREELTDRARIQLCFPHPLEPLILTNQIISVCKGKPVNY